MTKTVTLGEICKNLDGKRIPLNDLERRAKSKVGLYPYVGANNIVGYLDEFIFDEKILCVAEDGGSWGANQKCAFIMDEKCWVNNHAHVLSAKPNTSLEYLMYYLNYKDLNSYITGSTRGKLNKSALERIKIPLPPLPEQRRIAALLDRADALRQKDRQLLAHYDKLAQSLFLDMFGDPVKNEKGWETKTVSELIDEKRPLTYGILMPGEDIPNGIPYVRVVDIKNGTVLVEQIKRTTKEIANTYKRSILKGGDLLISIRGHVGRMGIVPDEIAGANITQDTARIAIQKNIANSWYVMNCLAQPKMQHILARYVKGAAVKGINLTDLKEINIPIPPLSLQTHFAQLMEQIERQKAVVRQQMAASEALFGRLLQESFG